MVVILNPQQRRSRRTCAVDVRMTQCVDAVTTRATLSNGHAPVSPLSIHIVICRSNDHLRIVN